MWNSAFETSRGRRIAFALLYLSEGAPIGYIWWALPTQLRAAGMEVSAVTQLTSLLVLPWAFKFVWAPLVDGLRSPRFGIRPWILGAQIVMLLTLAPLSVLISGQNLLLITPLLLAHAMAAATQDVAIDALCIEAAPADERGVLNGWMQLGMLTGRGLLGGGALWLEQYVGAQGVVWLLLACVALPMPVVFLLRDPRTRSSATPGADPRETRALAAVGRVLSAAARSPRTLWGFGFALIGGAAFEAVGSVAGPLLVDQGATPETVGAFFALPTVAAMGAGALIGGWWADRGERVTLCMVQTVWVALLVAGLAVLIEVGAARPVLIAAMTLVYLSIGSFTATSYALFMDLTDRRLAGTQYSAYMGMTNLCESWAGFAAGRLVTSTGYPEAFGIMAGLSLLALPVLLRIRRCGVALVVALVLAAVGPSDAGAQIAGGYGDYLDWEGWARVASFERPGLASSVDPRGGDLDFNHYAFPPGLVFQDRVTTAATIAGPGIIYRFWMPHRTAAQAFAVRMYFDGESTPRIDSDSQQILSGNFGYFRGSLVSTFAGGQVCYEPIAFRDSVRIETENRAGLQHYYQYGYRTFAPDTDLASWDGSLGPAEMAAREATIAMFEHTGDHPAGADVNAEIRVVESVTVPGGDTLTLGQLDGPGLIRRLNLRMDEAPDTHLDGLRLLVYWDADSLPSIDVPVGWFFGAGHERAPYRSLPMGTDSPQGFYCYWPMPFRAAARVQLANGLFEPVAIDSAILEYVPAETDTTLAYLHAVAREGVRQPETTRFAMAEVRGTGHYVGNFLFLEQDFDHDLMLEGDDIVVIDGQTISGTGLEDAYNGGFYYNWVANPTPDPEGASPPFAIRPLNGILRREKRPTPPFSRADQYRWMIADRMAFEHSLEVSLETGYSQPGSRWKSVVFWYELPPPGSGLDEPPQEGTLLRGPELRSIEPNPATESLLVRFAVPADGIVSMDLLDIAGRRVATLTGGVWSAGLHAISWSRGSLPDGVYMIRLRAGGRVAFRKLVLLR